MRRAALLVLLGLAICAVTVAAQQARPVAAEVLIVGNRPHQPPPRATCQLPTVSFDRATFRAAETVTSVELVVSLNARPSQTVTVDYGVTGGTASATELGSGQDYALPAGTLIFAPGTFTRTIPLTVVNDVINEADETVVVALANPDGAVLGGKSTHTYTLVDDDRALLVDVMADFGARGDGVTDDTAAIQAAVDAVYDGGGGVVLFPPGVYLATSVAIRENVTYSGYGATIKRPPDQGNWMRTFTTGRNPYAGAQDSAPLIIQGLTFDGNSQNQGPYQDYELEQAHLIFLMGDADYTGRLQAVVEDCRFQNGVADGVSVYTNVAAKVHNCEAVDVFRGGFVLTGGYSTAQVTDFTTRGEIDPTGIDVEPSGPGYGGTFRVEVTLERLELLDGDFDVAVWDGSTVTGQHIVADAPFYLYSRQSTVRFAHSSFKVGASDGETNRILFPHDVLFEDCTLYVTRQETGRPYDFFAAVDVAWQHPSYETEQNQALVFQDCRFLVDNSIQDEDLTYAIFSRADPGENHNRLMVEEGCIAGNFDQWTVIQPDGVQPVVSAEQCRLMYLPAVSRIGDDRP